MESPMHGAAASTLKSTETVNSIKGEAAEGGLKQIKSLVKGSTCTL